jgi:hypothetical protein
MKAENRRTAHETLGSLTAHRDELRQLVSRHGLLRPCDSDLDLLVDATERCMRNKMIHDYRREPGDCLEHY